MTPSPSLSAEFGAQSLLTTHQAGALLQVNPSSISNWVKAGRIAAFRTPGGHVRIRATDLLAFLNQHQMPIPERLSRLGKRRVLFVDDDHRQLQSLERLFKAYRNSVEVLMTTNGIDALVEVGSFRPHLIILDVFMPEVDGLEVCRRLKARDETKTTEVVVATASLTPAIERRAREAGAKHVYRKPIPIDLILEELNVAPRIAAGS